MTSKYIKEQGFEYEDDRGYLRALFEGTVDLGIDAAGKPTGTGPIAAPPTPPPPPSLHGVWECKVCTFLNEPEHRRCQMCDVGTRPLRASPAPPALQRPALQRLPLERREL